MHDGVVEQLQPAVSQNGEVNLIADLDERGVADVGFVGARPCGYSVGAGKHRSRRGPTPHVRLPRTLRCFQDREISSWGHWIRIRLVTTDDRGRVLP